MNTMTTPDALKLAAQLRAHDDDRLYREADELMADAAALIEQQYAALDSLRAEVESLRAGRAVPHKQDALELVSIHQKAAIEFGQEPTEDNRQLLIEARLALLSALASPSIKVEAVSCVPTGWDITEKHSGFINATSPDGVSFTVIRAIDRSRREASIGAHFYDLCKSLLDSQQKQNEVIAWMWQHEETGNIGFVDQWQVDNGWRENNPRCKLVRALYAAPTPPQAEQAVSVEPFGYFKAEPFGWTDCAQTDEGAIALYEHPAQQTDDARDARRWRAATDDKRIDGPAVCAWRWNGVDEVYQYRRLTRHEAEEAIDAALIPQEAAMATPDAMGGK